MTPLRSASRFAPTVAGGLGVLLIGLGIVTAAPPGAGRLPVLAWGGPPAGETTAERYRELAEAGFTHNFSSFSNMSDGRPRCRPAAAFINCQHPELQHDPDKVVSGARNSGWPVTICVTSGSWRFRSLAVGAAHQAVARHLVIQSFPEYASAAQRRREYLEYLDRLSGVPLRCSFDHDRCW